jgi:hypothetical protein
MKTGSAIVASPRGRRALPFLALALGAMSLTGCIIIREGYSSPSGQPALELTVEQTDPAVTGRWSASLANVSRAKASQTWVQVNVRDARKNTIYGSSRSARDLPALLTAENRSWPGEFELGAEAGTLRLRGERSGSKASGEFALTPKPAYAEQVASLLSEAPSGMDWLWLVLYDVRADEIAAFVRAGGRLKAAELCRLKSFGVSPEYFGAVRADQAYSIDEVTRFKSHGVPADFPATVHKAGYDFDAAGLVRLRSYGVSGADAQAWGKANPNLSAEELVRLRSYGVTPAFGKAVYDVLGNPTVEQIIKLRSYGVSEQFLTEMRAADAHLTTDDLVHLRSYGVPADYVRAWRKAGFEFDARELTRLRSHGVPVDYAASLSTPNRKPLSCDAIIRLRQRGLSAQEIRELRE